MVARVDRGLPLDRLVVLAKPLPTCSVQSLLVRVSLCRGRFDRVIERRAPAFKEPRSTVREDSSWSPGQTWAPQRASRSGQGPERAAAIRWESFALDATHRSCGSAASPRGLLLGKVLYPRASARPGTRSVLPSTESSARTRRRDFTARRRARDGARGRGNGPSPCAGGPARRGRAAMRAPRRSADRARDGARGGGRPFRAEAPPRESLRPPRSRSWVIGPTSSGDAGQRPNRATTASEAGIPTNARARSCLRQPLRGGS